MKSFLAILLLMLFWSNLSLSKEYHNTIFGIKLLDQVNNYIEECEIDGKYLITENCPSILKQELELNSKDQIYIRSYLPNLFKKSIKDKTYVYPKIVFKWKKNPIFNTYGMTLDQNLKIVSILGFISFPEQKIDNFQNQCSQKKINLINKISQIHKIPTIKFVDNDYKMFFPTNNNLISISVDASDVRYKINEKQIILRISCTFNNRLDDNSAIITSRLSYSMRTVDLWNFRLTKINKSETKFEYIKNLTDSEIIRNDTGL